jgi:hypothetical protein
VCDNRVLKRVFGPRRNEVARGWKKLHKEELHNLYSSRSKSRKIKSRMMRWAGYMARMEREGMESSAYRNTQFNALFVHLKFTAGTYPLMQSSFTRNTPQDHSLLHTSCTLSTLKAHAVYCIPRASEAVCRNTVYCALFAPEALRRNTQFTGFLVHLKHSA